MDRTWLEVLDILSDFLDDAGRFVAQNHRRFEYKTPDGAVRPVVDVRPANANLGMENATEREWGGGCRRNRRRESIYRE